MNYETLKATVKSKLDPNNEPSMLAIQNAIAETIKEPTFSLVDCPLFFRMFAHVIYMETEYEKS